MVSKIYLIRHGRTDGNRNHWYYGATDLPLTEEGTEELKAYAAQNIYPEIPDDAQIFTTGLVRTDQTLEAIYGRRDHSAITKLQEINFGKAECMTYDELKVFDNFQKWAWDTTGDERIADAETANEFHDRIGEGLKELLEKHRMTELTHRDDGKDAVTAVVCHGGVIACIMEKLFPAVCGSMWDWLPEPGFGYVVDFEDGKPYMYTRINDIGRLGLGLYRLPLKGENRIDHKKTDSLIDIQMARGHGYFELEFLGWPEDRSEDAVGEERMVKAVRSSLVRRYDRSRYDLAAIIDAERLGEVKAMIRNSGAGYLDRLAVNGVERFYPSYPEDENIDPETLADKRIDGPQEKTAKPGSAFLDDIWSVVNDLKKNGLVKKAGLAFNGSATLLDDLLKERQEIDYVELPVNYLMGTSEGDLAQKYYTISRRRYKEILVRSPFAGGRLTDMGTEAEKVLGISRDGSKAGSGNDETESGKARFTMAGYAMMKKADAPASAVDWALRYVLSYPFVVISVASTGDPEHAAENLDAAERFRPLTEEDRDKLKEAVKYRD